MDLNDIALFVQVVRANGFAEAGRRLDIPPSTASRRVQQLERALGTRLLHRSTRRLALTDSGKSLFVECAERVDALMQSAQQVIDSSTTPHGKVRVAVPADFFNWFPADRVARFIAAHAQVQLEFELSDERADMLGETIDVALRAGHTIEPALVARQLGWSRVGLVASPSYLAARGKPKVPAELVAHDCITQPARGGPPITWRLEGPRRGVEIPVTGRFQANTAHAQLSAAVAGLGIARLPMAISDPHVRAGSLKQVLPDHALEKIGIYVVYLSRRQIPRAVSVFVEFVASTLIEQRAIQPVTARAQSV